MGTQGRSITEACFEKRTDEIVSFSERHPSLSARKVTPRLLSLGVSFLVKKAGFEAVFCVSKMGAGAKEQRAEAS